MTTLGSASFLRVGHTALLVFIVRNWIEQQPIESSGWLGALRDEQVGRALALMLTAVIKLYATKD